MTRLTFSFTCAASVQKAPLSATKRMKSSAAALTVGCFSLPLLVRYCLIITSHGVPRNSLLPVSMTLIGTASHRRIILLPFLVYLLSPLTGVLVTALSAAIATPFLFKIPTTVVMVLPPSSRRKYCA